MEKLFVGPRGTQSPRRMKAMTHRQACSAARQTGLAGAASWEDRKYEISAELQLKYEPNNRLTNTVGASSAEDPNSRKTNTKTEDRVVHRCRRSTQIKAKKKSSFPLARLVFYLCLSTTSVDNSLPPPNPSILRPTEFRIVFQFAPTLRTDSAEDPVF